jgi:cobalt-zinc-cadmium efflux system membrane fusion protein
VLRFPQGAPQLAEIRTGLAEPAPMPLTETLNARLAYDEGVTARVSSPVSGRVVALPADVGDRVKAGQAVLVIDSPEFGAALADAEKADADARRKELAWARAKSLYEGEVLPRKDLESAEADWQQARAEQRRARLRLDNLRARRAGATRDEAFALPAPISGVVTERSANPGMEVRPDLNTPLFVISDPTRLWALIDLPENLIDRVRLGMDVELEAPAFPGSRFRGKVARVSPALDASTRRVPVRVEVANPDGRLRPEMFARARLLAPHDAGRQVLRLPAAAVVTEGVGHVVFVERSPGEFAKQRIEVALQDHDYVFVAGGLEADEKVVQAGALLLASELAGGD